LITLIKILLLLTDVLSFIIVVQFILSILIAFNVVNEYNSFVRSLMQGLDRLLNPLYRPIRRVLPNTGAIDFSPAVVLILLEIVRIVLGDLASSLIAGTPM
jgi:YggT family protein